MAGALETEDVTVMPAADVDPAGMGDYDLAVLGSGVYMGKVGDTIQTLVKTATALPPRIAFFTTHSNPDPDMWKNAFLKVHREVEKAGSTVVGEFECAGENTVTPVEMLLQLYQGDQEKVDAYLECARGHPNEEDEEAAQAFAKSLVV
jgi:flavodoxin